MKLIENYIYFLVEKSFQFDFNKFKSLFDLKKQIEYAKQSLSILSDSGQGRIIFKLGTDKVLKIARQAVGFANGIQQNLQEIKLYEKLNSLNIVPKIYAFDPNGNWIIVEQVKTFNELTNDDFIFQYTGLYWDEYEIILDELLKPRGPWSADQLLHPEKYPDIQDEIEEITDFGSDWRNNQFMRKIFKAISFGVRSPELLVKNHYGINSNGELVIVDYGF